jgi:hypothetical protein
VMWRTTEAAFAIAIAGEKKPVWRALFVHQ